MHNFVFHNPTKIVFGTGAANQLGPEAARYGKKALLVYGKASIKTNGIYAACAKTLADAGITIVEHGGVKPNPTLSFVHDGIRLARSSGCDLVLAAGGGSSIDSAKAIAAGVPYKGEVWDFYCGKAEIKEALPILAVLTIAATGSEMNGGSVITNEKTKQKYSAHSPLLYPKTSFLDPENTFSVPPLQTAYGAVDAASHLMESYFTTTEPSKAIQHELTEALIRNIIRASGVLMRDPRDYEARADMMWAATLALNGIIPAGLGNYDFICHAIEHSMSALHDIPHGAGLAITTCAWFEHRKKVMESNLARFGRNIFNIQKNRDEDTAAECIVKFRAWCTGMNVPVQLSKLDIPASAIPAIADNAMATLKLWRIEGYSKEDITAILNLAA